MTNSRFLYETSAVELRLHVNIVKSASTNATTIVRFQDYKSKIDKC